MSLTAGTHLGPYEILGPIGAGGMGAVYRARDTRLDREVAIKVLNDALADDPSAHARFEREAKAVAALSHPNILAIHEFAVHDSVRYSVSELLTGETLHDRLARGPLPPRKALEYAVQIARGLAAAHERGIVHRDLKPANIFLASDGQVKILDFGLARTALSETDETKATPTTAGFVLGTAAYMSPEQARGQSVDSRSDVFALGAVAYEMLCGRPPFRRTTYADTITAVLKDDPEDPSAIVADLPEPVCAIVRRCLEKNPNERFQSARDLAFAFENLAGVSTTSVPPQLAHAPSAFNRRRRVRALAIGTALVGVAAAVSAGWLAHSIAAPGSDAAASAFVQLTDFPSTEHSPSVSREGNTVVYASDASGNFDIFSMRVGGRNPINLTADSPDGDVTPALSPTAERIAFRSYRRGGGIFVMGATGESLRRITDFGYDPSWSPDGQRLVVSSVNGTTPYERAHAGQLSLINLESGTVQPLSTPHDAVQPSWSPSGRHIAYWSLEVGTGRRDIWIKAVDAPDLPVQITNDVAVDWNPVWSRDGRHLYFASDRGGVMTIWGVPIDTTTGRAMGSATPVSLPASYLTGFSLTAEGFAVFAATDRRSRVVRLDFDSAAEVVTNASVLLESSRTYRSPDWSPDGNLLVFSNFGQTENLYLIRADGTGYRQLTDDGFRNRGPKWFPDGSRVLFYSNRNKIYQAWSIRSDGSNPMQLIGSTAVVLPVLSPTANRIAYKPSLSARWLIGDLGVPGGQHREMPPAPGDATPTPSSWSKDGLRIALFDPKPGVTETPMFVYDLASDKYVPLPTLGLNPAWLPDGRRLIFSNRQGISLIDTVSGRTREIYKLPTYSSTPIFGLAVSADGRKIALLLLDERSDLWMLRRP